MLSLPETQFSPAPSRLSQKPLLSTSVKVTILASIVIGFISAFVSGYFFNQLLKPQQVIEQVVPVESKNPDEPDQPYEPFTVLPESKKYFSDSLMMVQKTEPHVSFIVTVTRAQSDTGYTQNVRTSYFDGQSWVRKVNSTATIDSDVAPNSLLTEWSNVIDPTKVLKESFSGTEVFDGKTFRFKTGELRNEIGMRSLPEYTKFMSNGEGELTIDGQSYDVYVLYTKLYSEDASQVQVYDGSLGITTHWLAFWDTQGNFYHADVTKVERPTPSYQSHEIGIWEDSTGRVSKTFKVQVDKNEASPPDFYSVGFDDPINTTLQLNLLNYYDKISLQSSYKWVLGQVQGTVTTANGRVVPGFGLLEYIYN